MYEWINDKHFSVENYYVTSYYILYILKGMMPKYKTVY